MKQHSKIFNEKTKSSILGLLMREPLSFSEILKKSGLHDHGQLNYHLRLLLREGIIEKKEEKYHVTGLGERLGVYLNQFQSKEMYPISVVAPLIYDEKKRVLMVKRLVNPQKGRYGFPGGKVLLGETLFDAAEREVFEETGLRIKGKKVLGFIPSLVYKNGALSFHAYIIPVLMQGVSSDVKITLDDKGEDYAFIPLNDMSKYPLIPHNSDILKEINSNKFLFKEIVFKE